jgi:hypothetical protein
MGTRMMKWKLPQSSSRTMRPTGVCTGHQLKMAELIGMGDPNMFQPGPIILWAKHAFIAPP